MLRISLTGFMCASIALIMGAIGSASQASTQDAEKRPFLHPLFADNMVIQRDMKSPIWGWAKPGSKIVVEIAGKSRVGIADKDGNWMVRIGPFPAGGPYTIQVSGPQKVLLNNVLFGDVWLCSGQSNMSFGVGSGKDAEAEIKSADHPNIRLFTSPAIVSVSPADSLSGHWDVCSPGSVSGFSAVGYFFGRSLQKELGVPIGLIQAAEGGTPIRAWTSLEGLRTVSELSPMLKELDQNIADRKDPSFSLDKVMESWWNKVAPANDCGIKWSDAGFDASGWKVAKGFPTYWSGIGIEGSGGVVWFRRSFDLPVEWSGKEALLQLGYSKDRDVTWINGKLVGMNNGFWNGSEYTVPAGLLHAGKNEIAIGVLAEELSGGMGRSIAREDFGLQQIGESKSKLSLAGDWEYHVQKALAELPSFPMRLESDQMLPTVLYNGAIAPLTKFGIKGAIWYQGETDSEKDAPLYRKTLPALIADWRSKFGIGKFPFLIVQLANHGHVNSSAVDEYPRYGIVREAQLLTSLTVENTGLAVSTDVSDPEVHPLNKQDVGHRLALTALGVAYKKKIEYSGPIYTSMTVRGKSIVLSFGHTRGGLIAKGGRLEGFAIGGADKKFVRADAVIDGNKVVVSAPDVDSPVAVRYAWKENPLLTLYNGSDLPASPFRTDVD